jgi:transcriptional regulator with XRE-family HTH domain
MGTVEGREVTRLRELIRDEGNKPITSAELGRRVGLSRSQMRRVELGKVALSDLPYRVILGLSRELGKGFDALVAKPSSGRASGARKAYVPARQAMEARDRRHGERRKEEGQPE